MKKLKPLPAELLTEIYQYAQDLFGSNLIDVGIGGSRNYDPGGHDLDLILILHKTDFPKIRIFGKKYGRSISILTKAQLEDKFSWGTKVATMIYKGATFAKLKLGISITELKAICRRGIAEEIQNIDRKLVTEEITFEKAYELVRQKALLCLGNT